MFFLPTIVVLSKFKRTGGLDERTDHTGGFVGGGSSLSSVRLSVCSTDDRRSIEPLVVAANCSMALTKACAPPVRVELSVVQCSAIRRSFPG